MRVLVTGGTGYLGSAVVRALARRGHTPIVFARRVERLPRDVASIAGDLRSPDAVDGAVARAEAVCHAGALVSLWRRRAADFEDVNVEGTRHVLAACARHEVQRLVYTSSFLAYPPAGQRDALTANDYQRTKVRALALVRDAARSHRGIVTLAPAVVYGPGPVTEGNLVGRLLRDFIHGRLPFIVGADRLWSLAWIDAVAEAHVAAVEGCAHEREYLLGGPPVPQRRLFEIAARACRRRAPRELPAPAARAIGAVEEMRAFLTGRPPLLTRGAVAIFGHDWPVDAAAARKDLQYRTPDPDEGIAEVLGELT